MWPPGHTRVGGAAAALNHPIYEARSRELIMHAVSKILISQSALLFMHARAAAA